MENIEIKASCIYKDNDHEIILSNNKLMIIGKDSKIILIENIVKLYFEEASIIFVGHLEISILNEEISTFIYFLYSQNKKFVQINELVNSIIIHLDKNRAFVLNKSPELEIPSNKNDNKLDNQIDMYNIIECVNCKNVLNNNSNFCSKCGLEVIFITKCNSCKCEIKSNSRFCKYCGTKI